MLKVQVCMLMISEETGQRTKQMLIMSPSLLPVHHPHFHLPIWMPWMMLLARVSELLVCLNIKKRTLVNNLLRVLYILETRDDDLDALPPIFPWPIPKIIFPPTHLSLAFSQDNLLVTFYALKCM